MASLQVSGPIQASTTSNQQGSVGGTLITGNQTNGNSTVTSSGSPRMKSQITILGNHTNVTNNNFVNIQIPQIIVNSNWSLDVTARSLSNNNAARVDWVVLKPTSDSASWAVFPGLENVTSNANLLVPTLSVNTSTRVISLSQPAAGTDDGPIYYTVIFEFTSGNVATIQVPFFM